LTAMHFHFHFILHILHYYGRHVTNCDNVFMLFYEFQQSANGVKSSVLIQNKGVYNPDS
jgi:hypothetical protein